MQAMQSRSSLPDINRIGILTAAVLLAFALTRLLPASQVVLRLTLGNFFLTYPVSLTTVMTLLAAGVTATGMDWLLRSHPGLAPRRTVEHWLLPMLTTFVIGVPLSLLPGGASWWVTFAVAGLGLVTVFIAEYTAVDPTAPAYSAATGLLTALSFAVYLILLTTMRSSSPRLIIAAPGGVHCQWIGVPAFPAPAPATLGICLGRRHRTHHCATCLGPALLAAFAHPVWTGSARSALRADFAGGQPGGGSARPTCSHRTVHRSDPGMGCGCVPGLG